MEIRYPPEATIERILFDDGSGDSFDIKCKEGYAVNIHEFNVST